MVSLVADVLTAAEAQDMAVRAAFWLRRQGLVVGDRVAIVTPEHRFDKPQSARMQTQTIGISLGCLLSGLVPVMINPLLTPMERESIIADARPLAVLTDQQDFERVLQPVGQASLPNLAVVPLGRPMHYTSGTTGSAKGVWTHDLSEAESTLLWSEEQAQWGFEASDRYLLHGPLCHSAPLRFAHATVLAGGSVITQGWFDAQETAAAINGLKPTITFAVPAQIQRLLELAEAPASPYRLLAHAGAACPPDLKRRIHTWAGIDQVWEFYGSTEGQFSACSGREWEDRPGTVGRARPHRRLHLEKEQIWCSAPHYARFRYWGDERKTQQAVRIESTGIQFSVGDLGRIDKDGYLFLEGRREDLIISGGVNVYPAEVEAALSALPGVVEVAVFGIDDERWGQRVEAAFVGSADPQTISELTRELLGAHKRPKRIHRVDSLPHTTSGKIQRRLVAEAFSDGSTL